MVWLLCSHLLTGFPVFSHLNAHPVNIYSMEQKNTVLCSSIRLIQLHCNSITIQSGLRQPIIVSFVPIHSLLLTTDLTPSTQQHLAHYITNTLEYNHAVSYLALTAVPTHPRALHHPTCDRFLGAGRLPQRLGFHCDLRVDISKERHIDAKLRFIQPEMQWAADRHTVPPP